MTQEVKMLDKQENGDYDFYTQIGGVRISTKNKLEKLKDELNLTWNGVLVHLIENR